MNKGFDAETYPAALWTPERLMRQSARLGHIPFAFTLVEMLRPKRLVELGSHRGDSYFAFCQAVERLGLETECFAVDTWAGDIHTGEYPDEIFHSVQAYNSRKYPGFSTLMRCFFDEALSNFEAGGIDLLHIDGMHTYDAVRHDFETWLPKMSEQGVVLMHDVAEFQDEFGVWRFYREVCRDFPSFTFPFEHGLGVVAVGKKLPETVGLFFEDKAHVPQTVHYFSMLGERVREMGESRAGDGLQSASNVSEETKVAGRGASFGDVRVLSFFLPQYQPTPENDLWWGKGFTEWTNVAQARPLFEGHDQPRVPADLGFYDLRLPETREAQAELARRHGISGFCYYHYWFRGRRILERTVNEILASGEPDFPFCLCWANHTWTSHWNHGLSSRLIEQEYSEKDDLEHIRWLLEVFKDRRYIRVNGRPLLLVYVVEDLPDPEKTFDLWREEARKAGVPEPYICKVEAFRDFSDPHDSGCDASVEFPPHQTQKGVKRLSGTEDAYSKNAFYEYTEFAETYIEREKPSFTVFPSVMPGFDNTPRHRNGGASIYLRSTPERYGEWLEASIKRAQKNPPGERIVFVNAWNEWGEGNYLEPDLKNGGAYLEETKRVLENAGLKPGASAPGTEEIKATGSLPTLNERYADLLEKYAAIQKDMLERLEFEEDLVMPPRIRKEHEASRQRMSELQDAVRKNRDALVVRNQEVKQLIQFLNEINQSSQRLFSSRSWKIANFVSAAVRRLNYEISLVSHARQVRNTVKTFRVWRKNRVVRKLDNTDERKKTEAPK